MREVHDRVASVGDEHHLDGAAARGHVGVIGDAPGEDDPMRWLHFDEAAPGGDAAEVQGEPPARSGVEVDLIPDPGDHEPRVGEVGEHGVGGCLDSHARADHVGQLLSGRGWSRLDSLLQACEGVRPELVEKRPQRLERLGAQRVEPAGPFAMLGQEPGALEDAEVQADGLLGEVEVRGDLSGGELGVLDQPQDLAPVRIGERPQDRIGSCGGAGSRLRSSSLLSNGGQPIRPSVFSSGCVRPAKRRTARRGALGLPAARSTNSTRLAR